MFDAPRAISKSTGADLKEMGRTKENGFCCGAGGAECGWKKQWARE